MWTQMHGYLVAFPLKHFTVYLELHLKCKTGTNRVLRLNSGMVTLQLQGQDSGHYWQFFSTFQ